MLLREEPLLLRQEVNYVRQRWRRRQLVRVLKAVSVLNKTIVRTAKVIGKILIFVLESMFDGGTMVREQGPGMRPLERHEFERRYRDELGGRERP